LIFSSKLATRFLNAQTGEFLQATPTVVSTNKADNSQGQNWVVRDVGQLDWVTIENQATGKYLDSDEQGNVFTSDSSEQDRQKWRFVGQTIINVATGRALESNALRSVFTQPLSGQASQNWLQSQL
jgi:hypothetical protein